MKHLSICLLLLVSLYLTRCNLAKAPFRSRKSPKDTIHSYEIVHLDVSDPTLSDTATAAAEKGKTLQQTDKRVHPYFMRVNVKTDSNELLFQLNLRLNKNLLAPHFTSVHYEGNSKITQGHSNCFYHGTVAGHLKWKAVISTCQGLRGWFGDLGDRNSLYHLEPLHDARELDMPHVLYKDTECGEEEPAACGTTSHHKGTTGHSVDSMFHELDTTKHQRLRRQSAENIVELLIVNDFHQYTAYSSNITTVVLKAIEVFNHVDMLYQVLNVRVVIVHSLTWTVRQEITFNSNPNQLLTLFRNYHSSNNDFRSITHDSAQLITGINLDGNTVGIAYVGTMCNYDSSVGITEDANRRSVAQVSTIAAHEMGHTFGMDHDDSSACNCPDANAGCIMNAVSGFPPATNWSQCSRTELSNGFNANGNADLNRCLGNSPTTIVGQARCGNGIREPGEICDCGSVNECNDPCCNATSCTLLGSAQCSSGVCCENCRFRSYGTVCRNSSSECDVAEYCTGQSADCPQDVSRQNGISCDNRTAFCYDGICGSTRDQCRRYFGNDSVPSNEVCYSFFNTQGVGWGHCGADGTDFVACSNANFRCGSLQCSGGRIIFSNVNTGSSLTAYVRYTSNFECRTVTTPATVDEVSPGLVVDGAMCGTESMCVAQRCTALSALSGVRPCPVGSNGQTCSGNGICNNLNTCSCNIGYDGTDCSQRHEEVTSTSSSSTGVIAGSIVGVILLIVIAVAVIVVLAAVITLKKRKTVNLRASPSRAKYSRGPTRTTNTHGSRDDLLMVERANVSQSSSQSTSPVPQTAYNPYIPPPYSPSAAPPSVTVSNRPSPPQRPPPITNQTPPSRPGPSRAPPPKPTSHVPPQRPVNRAPPPAPPSARSSRPAPPPTKPVAPPKPSDPPVFPPVKPTAPPKPQTAPKPTKVQWPPPSAAAAEPKASAPPPPFKPKPLVPPRK